MRPGKAEGESFVFLPLAEAGRLGTLHLAWSCQMHYGHVILC